MARKKKARAAKKQPPRRARPRKKLNPVDKQVLTLGIYGGDPTSGQIATPPPSA